MAIYDTPADKAKVPPGFIAYSDKELRVLFSDDLAEGSLRRVHEAKRVGANITGVWNETGESQEALLATLQKGSRWLHGQHAALYGAPDSVDLDVYTKGLDRFDSLEANLRLAYGFEGCIFGPDKRCPEDAQPTCQACLGRQGRS